MALQLAKELGLGWCSANAVTGHCGSSKTQPCTVLVGVAAAAVMALPLFILGHSSLETKNKSKA